MFKSDHEFSCESEDEEQKIEVKTSIKKSQRVEENILLQVKHARTGTNRKRKRKVDYEESSEEEEEVPFACKKCGKWTTDLSRNFEIS